MEVGEPDEGHIHIFCVDNSAGLRHILYNKDLNDRNEILKSLVRLKKAFGDGTIDIKKFEEGSIFALKNFSFKEGIFNNSTATALYIIFFLFLVIFSIVTAYKMRVSYSENDINKV